MAKTFSNDEKKIASLFKDNTVFNMNGVKYSVKNVGKPTCPDGEPKTDIYIQAINTTNTKENIEIKISYKKSNADFVENKINANRAKQLFGNQWASIIEKSTSQIKEKFLELPLIYKKKHGRIKEGSFTLGWKFELLNKKSGKLSEKMIMTKQQVLDAYSGVNLDDNKKNSYVNGIIIPESGVANYMLVGDNFSSGQEVIDSLKTVSDYVEDFPTLYFACKALNFRSKEDKFDGDRPLSVYVDWHVTGDKKLNGIIKFNAPLITKGNKVHDELKKSMNKLKILTTDDVNLKNTNYDIVAK